MNKWAILLLIVAGFCIHMHGYYSGRGRGYAMGLVHGICEIHLKTTIADCPIHFDTWTGKVVNRNEK